MFVVIHESCMLTQQGTVYHAQMKTSTVKLPVDEYFQKSRLDIIPDLQFSYTAILIQIQQIHILHSWRNLFKRVRKCI